jgi:hypothetical protein
VYPGTPRTPGTSGTPGSRNELTLITSPSVMPLFRPASPQGGRPAPAHSSNLAYAAYLAYQAYLATGRAARPAD